MLGDGVPTRAVWYVDQGPPIVDLPAVSWSEVEAEDGCARNVEIGEDDLASIVYTSGTTGEPKGVMVSHRAILWQSGWLAGASELAFHDRIVGLTPLHSSMSTFDLCGATRAGAALYPATQPMAAFPSLLARFLSEQRLTICLAVPTLLAELVIHGNLSTLDFSSLPAHLHGRVGG